MNFVSFISRGKGMPKWFKEEWILIALGMHDLAKTIDYLYDKSSKIFGEENCSEIKKIRDEIYERMKEFHRLDFIAYKCMKEKRDLNEEEKEFIKNYLEKNQESLSTLFSDFGK